VAGVFRVNFSTGFRTSDTLQCFLSNLNAAQLLPYATSELCVTLGCFVHTCNRSKALVLRTIFNAITAGGACTVQYLFLLLFRTLVFLFLVMCSHAGACKRTGFTDSSGSFSRQLVAINRWSGTAMSGLAELVWQATFTKISA
jgi:hypothetical protein